MPDQSPEPIVSSALLAEATAIVTHLTPKASVVAGKACVQPSNEACPSAKVVVVPVDSTSFFSAKFQNKSLSTSTGALLLSLLR